MTTLTMKRIRHLLLMSLVTTVLLAGCGLSSEPEIAQEIPLPTSRPETVAPAQAPDLTSGAAFYAEHCVMCHGPGGRGDGEMVADGRLQNPPPDLADASRRRDLSPGDYLVAITEGNMLSGMPPFGRYTLTERWDVAAYVYTAPLTAEGLALGEQVYAVECAACHGPAGRGDGPQAAEIMQDLTDSSFWAARSDDQLFSVVSEGFLPEMPAFADHLSADERWAVVGYVRSLAVTGTPGLADLGPVEQAAAPTDVPVTAPETVAPETVAPETVAADNTPADSASPAAAGTAVAAAVEEPALIAVTGQVTNSTEGGSLPAGATITLHMFDPPDFIETTLETTVGADGTYAFSAVPQEAERVYLLSLQVDEVFFSSTVYGLEDPAQPSIETSVEIFDQTDDPSVVTISAGVMRVTFTSFGMEVVEVLSIENRSDRLFLTDERYSENQRIALRIPLPPGAGGVGFEPGMQNTRYFVSEDGATIYDTNPLRPGTDEFFISFFIPYDDGAIIEQELPYAIDGPFHLLVEASQVSLTSEMFLGDGERVDMGGQPFEAYVADLDLPPGQVISYTVSGRPEAVAAAQQAQQGGDSGGLSPLVLGLVIIGLLFIGAGGFMFLLRQGSPDPRQAAIDDLLDQIAELDDQNERGQLNHDYYGRKRAALKAELADLMQQQADNQDGNAS